MEYFPAPLEKLVEQFARLPGVGYKSAQRLAFYVLSLPEQERKQFLYGSSGDALCAWIWWDHNGFYKIDIDCGELSCIIRTGTDGLVRSISVSG